CTPRRQKAQAQLPRRGAGLEVFYPESTGVPGCLVAGSGRYCGCAKVEGERVQLSQRHVLVLPCATKQQQQHSSKSMQEHVVDESRGPYFPFNRRETYPKRLKVDFRRLPTSTLLTYTAHHDLHVRPDSTHEELAIATARHFAAWRINEESIMHSFCQGLASSTIGTPTRTLGDAENNKRKRLDSLDRDLNIVPPSPELLGLANAAAASIGRGSRRDPHHKSSSNPRSPPRSRSRGGAANSNGGGGVRDRASDRRGGDGGLGLLAQGAASSSSLFTHRPIVFDTAEQVAAYVSGAWILARVVQHKGYGKVELHDEDDASHVFELPISQVRHLEDLSSDLGKHDKVLAVFPDTTI
ncbi:unnamed protein product, partial [Ectocarpus sp. 8 AP-2014]